MWCLSVWVTVESLTSVSGSVMDSWIFSGLPVVLSKPSGVLFSAAGWDDIIMWVRLMIQRFNSSFWAFYLSWNINTAATALPGSATQKKPGCLFVLGGGFLAVLCCSDIGAQLHQRAMNVSFEDLSGWRWFPRIGRCNPSEEEWGLGEHPGGKRLRSDCDELWQLQIVLDRVFVVWWQNRTRTDWREEGRSDIKTEQLVWHLRTQTGNETNVESMKQRRAVNQTISLSASLQSVQSDFWTMNKSDPGDLVWIGLGADPSKRGTWVWNEFSSNPNHQKTFCGFVSSCWSRVVPEQVCGLVTHIVRLWRPVHQGVLLHLVCSSVECQWPDMTRSFTSPPTKLSTLCNSRWTALHASAQTQTEPEQKCDVCPPWMNRTTGVTVSWTTSWAFSVNRSIRLT